MLSNRKNKYEAITLVELVLYLALFSMVILVMVQFFVFISNKNVDARNRLDISRAVVFLRQHFSQTESKIQSVDNSNSVFDNDNGKLVLNTDDGVREYKLTDNKIYFNNTSDILLTPSGVIINQLRFEKQVDSLNNIIGVIVKITITHVNVVNYTESFEFLIQPK